MVVVDDLIDSLMQVALGKVQQAFGFGQFSFQVRDYLFAGFNFALAGNDLSLGWFDTVVGSESAAGLNRGLPAFQFRPGVLATLLFDWPERPKLATPAVGDNAPEPCGRRQTVRGLRR